MPIIFEAPGPYDLPVAQTAEARSENEIVELILTVSFPELQLAPVRIRAPITWKTAQDLGVQLGPVSVAAEMRARKLRG
jgi:hypothetical protein